MAEVFEYAERGRRLAVWLGLAVFCLLAVVGITQNAPAAVWAIWIPSAAMLLYLLLRDPVSGLRITAQQIEVFRGTRRRVYNRDEIAGVRITEWSDSTEVSICLQGGEEIPLAAASVPPAPKLQSALQAQGFPVLTG